MKKWIVLILVLFLTSFAYSAVTPDTVVFTGDANPVTTAAGASVSLGGDGPYDAITCHVNGTSGTMNVDIDGSLDDSTYYGMMDDITAVGGYSVESGTQPFNYYQIDVDACSGACSLTIICQPVKALKR